MCPSINPGHITLELQSISLSPSYEPIPIIVSSIIPISPSSISSVNTLINLLFLSTKSHLSFPIVAPFPFINISIIPPKFLELYVFCMLL